MLLKEIGLADVEQDRDYNPEVSISSEDEDGLRQVIYVADEEELQDLFKTYNVDVELSYEEDIEHIELYGKVDDIIDALQNILPPNKESWHNIVMRAATRFVASQHPPR